MGVAWSLIPAHGAVGACIGSGAAQITAVGMMWAIGIHRYQVKLPWAQVARITFASVAAAVTAHAIAVRLSPLYAVLGGGAASLVVLFGLFYFMRVLEPQDYERFKILTAILPKPISGSVNKFLSLLVRPEYAA